MFTPSSDDVRRFFCEAFRKQRAGEILGPMEAIAADWIALHPEYADTMTDVDAALARDFSVEGGEANPFLHLSMHLSISEQASVDQPRGIRDAINALTARLGQHDAHHQIMECLGEMIWNSQRNGLSVRWRKLATTVPIWPGARLLTPNDPSPPAFATRSLACCA